MNSDPLSIWQEFSNEFAKAEARLLSIMVFMRRRLGLPITDSVATGDPAPHAASPKERRDNALRALIAEGAIDRSTPAKTMQRLVFKQLGLTAATAPKGFSEDTIARLCRNLTH
jgi:hypothetical protein